MKRFFKSVQVFMLSATMILGTTALHMEEAEARRAGGGGSFGRSSSSSIFNKPSSPAQSTTTNRTASSQPDASRAQSTNGATATAGTTRRNSFLGPLGGIAAGLGLAALFSYMGFGEGMASILGTILMFGLAFFVVRMIFRMMSRQGVRQTPAFGQAGASSGGAGYGNRAGSSSEGQFGAARQSLPQDVPNNSRSAFEGGLGASGVAQAEAASPQEAVKVLPAGFDESKFLVSAKQFFAMIQESYDQADLQRLREYTNDEVYQQFVSEINERAGAENHTSVVSLQAELLGFEVDVDEQIATVAFSGMIREAKGGLAEDIREFWVLTRPVAGGGWVLAGIHNL